MRKWDGLTWVFEFLFAELQNTGGLCCELGSAVGQELRGCGETVDETWVNDFSQERGFTVDRSL